MIKEFTEVEKLEKELLSNEKIINRLIKENDIYKKAFDLAVDAFFESGIDKGDCAKYCSYAREHNMLECDECNQDYCGDYITNCFMTLARLDRTY